MAKKMKLQLKPWHILVSIIILYLLVFVARKATTINIIGTQTTCASNRTYYTNLGWSCTQCTYVEYSFATGYEVTCTGDSTCTPVWTCSAWSACVNGVQTRTCTDTNNCGTTLGRPALSQTCVISECTSTSNCQVPEVCYNSQCGLWQLCGDNSCVWIMTSIMGMTEYVV
jgi:hypothetical protein